VLTYVVRRLGGVVLLAFGMSIVVFLMIRLIPGNPVLAMLGTNSVEPLLVHRVTVQLGLNLPLPTQYFHWIGNLLTGNLGYSYAQQAPVGRLISENLPYTLELTGAGLAFSLVFGSALGILAALKRNSAIDTCAMGFALACIAMPSFWLGLLLLTLFAVQVHWFPVFGGTSLQGLVLPAVTLGLAEMALTARFVRSSVIEASGREHVAIARAKGLTRRTVLVRHILRNAILPVLTITGIQTGNLLSGAVIIETVFSRPGIGELLVHAILAKDYELVQSVVLIIALMYALLNVLVDLAYPLLDPRIARG
jgi:ABC-type dipeptide/oligopeptide/nickel transport system permease component